MDLYVIDFETYYSKEYSLSGMTTAEYVLHENFEVILVGIRYPDGRKEWITGTHAEIQHFFNGIDFSNAAILCHHTLFDGAILAWHFNVRPKRWLDTLCMARAMFGNKGNSLKALAEKFSLPAKGEEVHTMLGRRRLSLSKIELEKYAGYCLNDVEITYQLFQILAEGWYDPETLDKRDPFPKDEYKLIDLTIRMFTEPVLRLNPTKLNSHLTAVKDRKAALLSAVGIDRGELLSNDKFAKQLIAFGVVPPTKISPTTGKETYAFAKTDPGLKELQEHDDERVQALVAARLGVKSTLEETRTERLLVVAGLTPKHKMPVPLTYCAAHTKRYGGADKINLQNLPSRGANAGELKDCIEAPEGWELGDCDSSNIEARMLAWWAMQDDLVADFANGVDVYSKMASKIYGRHVDRKKVEGDKEAGFVGKTVVLGCLAGDTLVLTDSGWRPIVGVRLSDKLWDGNSWVNHKGLIPKGQKEVLTVSGLSCTADHEILTEHGWQEWSEVCSSPRLFLSATNRGNLQSLIGCNIIQIKGVAQGGIQKLDAHAGGKGLCLEATISTDAPQDVTPAQNKLPANGLSTIGGTKTLLRTTQSGKAYSTELQSAYPAASVQHTPDTTNTVDGGLGYCLNGYPIGKSSLGTSYPSQGGTSQEWNLIESTTIEDTSQETCVGVLDEKICLTDAQLVECKKNLTNSKQNWHVLKGVTETYDIAMSGPRNRFTVLTECGPIIVHNCGYQTGANKLQATLKAATPSMDMPIEWCEEVIKTYRASVPKIKALWYQAEKALEAIHSNQFMWLGRPGVVAVEGKKGIRLPSGLYLSYPQLHKNKDGDWEYKSDKGMTKIYGGKVVENCTQALARIVVGVQMLKITERLKVALTVHDSVIAVFKKEQRDEAARYIVECMRYVPDWAKGCPFNCEIKVGPSYGSVKELKV